MTIEPFKPAHLDEIDLQPAQTSWRAHRDPAYAEMLAQHVAVTARKDGQVLACAGVISLERDVGHAWAFVARGQRMIRFRHHVRRLFEVSGKRRILASTEADFPQGCRWLELLGFRRIDPIETLAGPDGRAHLLYVRVS
jgi:hypothetical protein